LHIQINGEAHELPEELTLSALIVKLGLAPERLAIERNREVVRRARWADTQITDGDQIEIVHFVGGGTSVVIPKRSCAVAR
jgi:thiamine biosynthesis protein ThiS